LSGADAYLVEDGPFRGGADWEVGVLGQYKDLWLIYHDISDIYDLWFINVYNGL
jgi:hypothetical protein